jgi:hypothetical protein
MIGGCRRRGGLDGVVVGLGVNLAFLSFRIYFGSRGCWKNDTKFVFTSKAPSNVEFLS